MTQKRRRWTHDRRALAPIPGLWAAVDPMAVMASGEPEAPAMGPRPSEMLRILSEHPFLHGLPAAFVASVANASRWSSYEKDEFLIRERELADGLYLILKGKAALEIASPGRTGIKVQTVGPGEVAGWSWLIPPYSSYLDVRALERTQVIKIDAGFLRGLLKKKPAVGFEFLMRLLPVLAQRLEYTMIQVMNVYGA